MGGKLDVVAMSAANSYTDMSVEGYGVQAGKNCQIASIENITGGKRLNFAWYDDEQVRKSATLDVMNGVDGKDGKNGTDGKDGKDGIDGKDGSQVSVNPIQATGTKVGEITVDGTKYTLYAPAGGGGGGESIQVLAMPTASQDNLGKIVEYIGTTTGSYTNGYFYECVSDGESIPTYSWTQKNVQPGGGASALDGLSDVDITTPTDGQVLAYDDSSSKWVNASGGSASDYTSLTNKPQINGVTLNGNKSSSDLKLQEKMQLTATTGATTSLVGKVYQYIGSTTTDTGVTFTHGNFYECYLDTQHSKYAWRRVNVQPAGATTLSGLTDTTISSPADGQFLKYDSSTSTWINSTSGTGGGHTIEDGTGTGLTQRDTLQFGDGLSASDDSTNSKTVVEVDEMPSADMSEVVSPLPSVRPNRSTILKQVLTAGQTSITFNNIPTTGDYIVDFYNSLGISYTAITPSSGSVTLTYPIQSSNMDVYCEIRGV